MLKQIKAPCPSHCYKNLTAVLDPARDEGPRRYFCYWRARSVPPSRENPLWSPSMYRTLGYCPSCGRYLPDFVELDEDGGQHFYGFDRNELFDRAMGIRAPGP
jgi:hypothetical protein